MNWGYRIALLYTSFVIFMLFLVYKSFTYDYHLVAKDYYKQEIEYQNEIDKMNNVKAQQKRLSFAQNAAQMISVSFPEDAQKAEILFFRPSNAKKDFRLPLSLSQEKRQVSLPTKGIDRGLWRVKVNWQSADGKPFYMEERILVAQDGTAKLAHQQEGVVINQNGTVRLEKDLNEKSRQEIKMPNKQ